jgi:hypothetical protein
VTLTLSIWAAVLSTVLAAIKIWEVWSARQRISIGYGVDYTGETGSSIVIANPSSKPLLITYWILLLEERSGLRWHSVDGRTLNAGSYYMTIGAHDHHVLHFRGEERFTWIPDDKGRDRVVLELSVAGRSKPLRLLVYRTNFTPSPA